MTAAPGELLVRGVAAAEAGRVAEGLQLIRAACVADPQDAEAHAQLGRWLSRLHRTDEALQAARTAMQVGPRLAQTFDTVGVIFSRAGLHEQAVDCFARAVALEPGSASLHFNHAASLKFLGRFDAAEAAYETCLRLDPRFWRAHSALAATRTQTGSQNHVERLQALLAEPPPDPDAELHLRHALAKELEDLGRDAEALSHLLAGNARKFAASGYDWARDRRLFDAVIALFPRPMPAPVAGNMGVVNEDDAPIFVVGMPRTGTTLVDRILASHPQVASAGESQNFGVLLKRASGTRTPQVLDEETLARSAQLDLAALTALGADYVRRTRPAQPAKPRFVDKMPLNFFYLGHIARALPNASLVVVRRHPLDTGLANFRQLFAAGFSYYDYARDLRAIGRYYAQFDRLVRHWQAVLPGRVHEVHYESLVSDQRGTTARLLDHCRLPWDDACLAFERNAGAVATASAVQVRRPIYASSVGRWRRCEQQLQPLIEELAAAGIGMPGLVTTPTPA
ncbi:MAG: sulfotransferase [Gammaproteobacteria bacterium]|nr:sulfotransferase [Gammaproteobacteria bacterium]MDH5175555.1 sulfotransferase [Gammaproteobacteria bacterium]MDH5226694.1 sulfotransferase [Gammaproteobacteria bacterium]